MLARIFAIACDVNYEPGLRALLNSLWAYHRGELAVFIYHRGFTAAALEELAAHPNRPHLFATSELPFPPSGMWEAKQQIFAHCLGRARCVYLLDADLVLTSRVDDVFELAEQGKIVSSSDGGERSYGEDYAVYGATVPGQRQPYLNSGALCLDVNRHWDLVGLWAFASPFGSYSPRNGFPLHLPGHGDQGTFNAIAARLDKGKDFHVLPEATWCDSTQGACVQVREVTENGCLEVWNVTASARQRLVHSSGPKWWTEAGRQHLPRFGDKLKCFEHFAHHETTDH